MLQYSWDLDNKPPNSFPPFEAAVKLKTAPSSLGLLSQWWRMLIIMLLPSYLKLSGSREQKKLLNQLENKGVIKSVEPYFCKVCGRRFYNNEKLVNHFKQIHEREHQKRLNQIESARGSRRVKLVIQ